MVRAAQIQKTESPCGGGTTPPPKQDSRKRYWGQRKLGLKLHSNEVFKLSLVVERDESLKRNATKGPSKILKSFAIPSPWWDEFLLRPRSHRMRSTLQHADANYGTHYSKWE